jgi:hypothetical protein
VRFAAALLISSAVCGLCLASCGGGSDREDAQSVLDVAFARPIHSADMQLDATLQVTGVSSLEKPIRIKANGPFKGNKGKLPSADLSLQVGTGGGQTVQTGFLSTGDRAFVKFQDVYYEQPAAEVRKANRSLATKKGGSRSLKSVGLDPRSWLGKARDRGDEKIAGVNTTHVSGTLDVKALLSNLNSFVKRSGGAIGGATGQAPPQPLRTNDINAIASVVKDPTFDVYVGKDDDTIRRVAGRLQVTVPKRDQSSVGGVQSGTLEFSIEFHNVNGNQKIEAPAKARPLSDLTNSLGTGALKDLAGGGGGGGSGSKGSAGPEGNSTPPTATTGPSQQAFKDYSNCLEKAKANDAEALQRCAQLLQR